MKIVFGCVTDNKPKYLLQSIYLVKSLRTFGGSIANSDFEVAYVDKIPDHYKNALSKYNVKFRNVPSYPSPNPCSNKLQFICHQADHLKEYDLVVLLDCDTLILQDPINYLTSSVGKISLKAAQYNTVSPQTILNLYK